MYTYSIIKLDEEHFDEVLADLKDQYKRGISSCPMLMMKLVPEGDPVWDKVGPMCDLFKKFRDAAAEEGVPVGVLIQASLGHGYSIVPAPFDKYVNVTDGREANSYCPLDRRFTDHFRDVLKRIASTRPAAIMLDDDFRMMLRDGKGCACPRHLKELEKRTGRRFTREELWHHICENPDSDPVIRAFVDLQRDTLIDTVRIFRAAIDEIDPSIQGINCTSGDVCEAVAFTSKIFAGAGNPTIVRVPNGTYAPISVKEFSATMRAAAVCSTKLRRRGIDVILAETDTVPFNRYGKNARYLHSHFTASILEGLVGAKHWLTRTSAFEPESGRAFRDILAEHRDFYEKLAEISKNLTWVGANSAFVEQESYLYHIEIPWAYHRNTWATKFFERVGIPFYFSDSFGKATFLEGGIVNDMTDGQIRAAFGGSVFATAEAAEQLIARGYGDLLGVNVEPWDGNFIAGEMYGSMSCTSTAQKNARRLIPTDAKTEELSYSFRYEGGKSVNCFPAVTLYERAPGLISVVYCGTPDAEHNYLEGFAFLNESRKKQLISVLKRVGALPVYYDGDAEICLRAGKVSDGRLLVAVFNLGYDPLASVPLYLEKTPREITALDKNGNERQIEFSEREDGIYEICASAEPMYPVILLIK